VKIFVEKRLADMRARPMMWAGTKESFGLQLVLLAEVALHPQLEGATAIAPMRELMQLLFGPGNAVPVDPIDDAWAAERVDRTMKFIAKAKGAFPDE
jgi:hypothetical protein